jgi:hypothetical protein
VNDDVELILHHLMKETNERFIAGPSLISERIYELMIFISVSQAILPFCNIIFLAKVQKYLVGGRLSDL